MWGRRLVLGVLFAFFSSPAGALTVTVAPALAAPGALMTLSLNQDGIPIVHVGGHRVKVSEIASRPRSWGFTFPKGVSPGPQPVRVEVGSTKAEEGRIDAWVESLGGLAERNVLPQPPRLLIGSVDKVTPEAIRNSLQRGLDLIRAGSNPGVLPPTWTIGIPS